MPGKAAWTLLEEDPDLEFEFMLAQKLGMTVRRMRAEMDTAEFLLWTRYYARRHQEQELENAKMGG